MRRIFIVLTAVFSSAIVCGQNFSTQGDGTLYSFKTLSETEGSGVTRDGNTFTVSKIDTIAAGDSFKMDEGVTVKFADGASLILKGKADLRCGQARTLLTLLDANGSSDGISVQNEDAVTEVSHLDFEYVGLSNYSSTGLTVSDCTFSKHLGGISSALFLGSNGARFQVTDCTFSDSQKSAIGGAANYSCNLEIGNCTFTHNSLANRNIPQLNLTAAPSIIIRNCVIEGEPTLNMVGGIGVANWFGTSGNHVTIEGCTISDNRYGITTMGIMDAVIKDNNLLNNNHETNPNNGGSGISLYDPYLQQTAMISGNHIEGSLWGITVIGCGQVNLGKTEVDPSAEDYNPGNNVFKDNGNNGVLYDLYNNSANTIYAQGNIWNVAVQDSASIEEVVFHKNDNADLGEVIFMPAGTPDGITSSITRQTTRQDMIYDMNGIRHHTSHPLSKGIYIVNGKKTICK